MFIRQFKFPLAKQAEKCIWLPREEGALQSGQRTESGTWRKADMLYSQQRSLNLKGLHFNESGSCSGKMDAGLGTDAWTESRKLSPKASSDWQKNKPNPKNFFCCKISPQPTGNISCQLLFSSNGVSFPPPLSPVLCLNSLIQTDRHQNNEY